MSWKALGSMCVLALLCSLSLQARAALNVSVEMGPDRVRPSEPLNALITVSNDGPGAVAGVALQAPVPVGIATFSTALVTNSVTCPPTVSNNGACDPTEVMNWNLGTIPAGASVTTSIAMFVAAATAPSTSIALVANVGAVTGSATVTVSADNALMLALDDDLDPVPAGGVLTYTLTYGNRSTTTVSGAALSLPLPAGVTFLSATGGGTLVGGNVEWTIGSLPATQSGQVQVRVAVDGALTAGSVLRVDAAQLDGTGIAAETARAMAVTSVANAVLGLAIEMNPDPVRPNEWTVAQMTVTNLTASAVFGVALQTRIPQAVNSVSPALVNGVITCPAGISNNGACDANELGNLSLGTLPAGAAVTISLPIPVGAAVPGGRLLALEALVRDDSSHQTRARQTVAVDVDGPLMLAVDDNVDPIAATGRLTYTLSYSNRSTNNVSSAALRFRVPAGATFVSATGSPSVTGDIVQWTLGNLPATQSDQRQVVVDVAALADGALLRIDDASIAGNGLTGAEITRAKAATVVGTPPLGLAVQVNPDPVRPSEWALAELTVTNRTDSPIFGITLAARFPQGIDAVSPALVTRTTSCPAGIINNGACDPVELGNWTVGTLPAGGSATISLPLPIDAATAAGRLLALDAIVSDDSSHQSRNTRTLAVDGDTPISLALDEDGDPARAGSVLTYTLTYANRSSTSLTGTSLSFPIPDGTSFVSATGGGTLTGGRVEWALGSLPATQNEQQQVVVAVGGGLVPGSLLRVDAARLAGSGVLPELARAQVMTSVTSSPVLGLAVEVNPDPVRPSEWANARLTVTNRTAASLFGVVLQGRLPQHINAISPALATGVVSCPAGISNNGACDGVEVGNWSLGTLSAGAAVTVHIPIPITAAAPAGRLLNLEALVSDDSAHQSLANQTIAVDTDHPLTLAVDEDLDAVLPGNLLTYSLTYGNRGTSAITGATLSLPVPGLGSFAGATGGTVTNGTLVWNLGTLPAGSGGRRKLFLTVPNNVPAGSILLANEAILRGTGPTPETARSNAATAVGASKRLGMDVALGRDPTQAGAALTGTVKVTNTTIAPLTGLVVEARVPFQVTAFSPTLLGGGGTTTCPAGISNNGACDSVELARWSIASIDPGATLTLTMPMTVVAGFSNGRLMPFDVRAVDDAGDLSTESRTALVAPFVDGDTDTLADIYDNCPFFANASQTDTDLDGRGNDCECTDQNGDGRNTVADIVAINVAIFNPGQITPLCDGNNDGQCNVNDIIASNIEIFSPTNTSICARQPVAGP